MIPLHKTIIHYLLSFNHTELKQTRYKKKKKKKGKNVDKSILIFHSSYFMKYSFAAAKIINPEEISFKRKGTMLKGRYRHSIIRFPARNRSGGEFIVLKGSRIANRNKNRVFNWLKSYASWVRN